jgi:hypothetical protein
LKKKVVNFEVLGKTGYVAGGPVPGFAAANEILIQSNFSI